MTQSEPKQVIQSGFDLPLRARESHREPDKDKKRQREPENGPEIL